MQMGVILQDNIEQKVTIIGSGLMGHGIALKFAQHGFSVNVYDPNKEGETRKVDNTCLLYTSPSPRDRTRSRMPSSA